MTAAAMTFISRSPAPALWLAAAILAGPEQAADRREGAGDREDRDADRRAR